MTKRINKTSCTCGLMVAYVADASMPFRQLENEDVTALVLHDGDAISFAFCHFCGGNERGPATKGIPSCECQTLTFWSNDTNIPIEYNREFNDYSIVGNESKGDIYFCPKCGGRLPESLRSELYTEPSPDEMKIIRDKVGHINQMSDFVKILGEPDKVSGPTEASHELKSIYGQRDIKRSYFYDSVANTVNLLIQEYEDGEIVVLFSGKSKKK